MVTPAPPPTLPPLTLVEITTPQSAPGAAIVFLILQRNQPVAGPAVRALLELDSADLQTAVFEVGCPHLLIGHPVVVSTRIGTMLNNAADLSIRISRSLPLSALVR